MYITGLDANFSVIRRNPVSKSNKVKKSSAQSSTTESPEVTLEKEVNEDQFLPMAESLPFIPEPQTSAPTAFARKNPPPSEGDTVNAWEMAGWMEELCNSGKKSDPKSEGESPRHCDTETWLSAYQEAHHTSG